MAGQHARAVVRLKARRFLAGLGALVAVTVGAGAVLGIGSPEFAAVEVLAIAVMLIADRKLSPAIERWDRGASGEEAVGKVLAALEPAGWRVIHDVSVGARGNIDHIAVGPAGLFTIETKSHAGRISAGRIDRRMLAQAYAQAKQLERMTGEEVTPLLVFSRAYLQPAVSRQRGVTVLPARMLAGHLGRRRATVDPARVEPLHARLGQALAAASANPS